MKLRVTLLVIIACCLGLLAFAVPKGKSNIASNEGLVLVMRANKHFEKKQYEKAQVLYQEALALKDGLYTKLCRERLNIINTMLAKQKSKASGKKQGPTVFTISQDSVKINYLGGDYPVYVVGENWKASTPSDEDWLHIEIDRRSSTVKITTSPNESTESRSSYVTIRNGKGQTKRVKVINEGAPEVLRSSAQNLVFTPQGETNIVDIDANTDWSLADVPSWLEAIKGLNDIEFTAKPNEENKDRIAQVKVETPSRQEIVINIIQGASLDSLAFSKNNLQFGPDGGDEYIHVLTDADDWRFGDFPHWCQLERVDDRTIRVHCTPNQPVGMPREASVNVTTGTQTLGVNVFQEAKPIVHIIPPDGIGGRPVSFGFRAGYLYPNISASSSSPYTFSAVNYAQGNAKEQASYSSSGGFSVGAFADIRLYKNLYLTPGIDFQYFKYKNEIDGVFDVVAARYATAYLRGDMLSSYKEDYTMMSLDVPVLVSYRIPVSNKSHFRISAGPVLSFGMKADMDFSGRSDSETMRLYKIINGQMTDQLLEGVTSSSHLNYAGKFNMYSKEVRQNFHTSSGISNESIITDVHFDEAPFSRINFGLRFGVGYEYMGISLDISYQWMLTNMANRKYWDSDRWKIFNNATELMNGYSQHDNLLMITLGYTLRY